MNKTRSEVIIKSGIYFILVNFLLAIFNVFVGLASNSIAIISDAAHSLTDAISGFLVIFCEKLAKNKKFRDRRQKIERITTIIIALLIIIAGADLIVESIEKILDPEPVEYSFASMIILVIGLIAKYLLAIYLKKTGAKHKSEVLVASGAETMNDALISIAVIFSALIYLIFKVDTEAYVSIFIAAIILKVGLEFIFPHLSRHHHHHLESNPDHDHCGKQ